MVRSDHSKAVWEILVPTVHRVSGKGIRVRFHRVWDARVRAITGGLTIQYPVKGEWVAPDGTLYRDRMIPVRIIATHEEFNKIMQITLKHYDELAVMGYMITSNTLILHKEDA